MLRLSTHPLYWLLTALPLLTARPAALAQTLDPTFAPVAVRLPQPAINRPTVNQVATDAQGRVLVGGGFDLVQGTRRGHLARLLPNGTFDATFNPGGAGLNGDVVALLALPTGQWLVGGSFSRYNGVATGPLVRLNADGTRDAAFMATGILPGYAVQNLALDSQGRVVALVSGPDREPAPVVKSQVLRLLPTGALDGSFRPDPALRVVGSLLAVDAADRVVVSELDGPTVGTLQSSTLRRLLPSGAPDPSFATGSQGLTGYLAVARPLPNGELLIGNSGYTAPSFAGTLLPRTLVGLHADGTLNTGFTPSVEGSVQFLKVTPAGHLLIGGVITSGNSAAVVARLLATGAPDPTFSPLSRADLPTPNDITPLAGGNVLVASSAWGPMNQQAPNVHRFTAGGTPDPTFTAPRLERFGAIQQLVRQSGDRMIAIGPFDSLNGQPARGIARLLADGAPDPTFTPDTLLRIYARESWYSPLDDRLVVDAADRLLLVLDQVYRFLPNGQRDTTFYQGSGAYLPGCLGCFGATTEGVTVLPNGRLLVTGSFDRYHGVTTTNVARLLPNGRPDSTFVTTGGAGNRRIVVLPDGSLRSYSAPMPGSVGYSVIGLDSTGAVRPNFGGGQWLNLTASVTDLPDGSFIVTNLQGGQPAVKYTPAGIPDPTFTPDPRLTGEYYSLMPLPDGRLLVHGEFNPYGTFGYSGVQAPLRCLLPDGQLDPTFQPVELGSGSWEEAYGPLLLQSTGKLVVGGSFTTVGADTEYPTLARLTNVLLGLTPEAGGAHNAQLVVFPNPTRESLTLRRPTAEAATATLLDLLGRPVRQWPLMATEQRVPLAGVPAGAYVVRVVSADGAQTRRVVVE